MLMRLYAELSKEKKVIITSTTARGAVPIQEELGEGATIARRSGVGTSKVEHIEAAMEYIANDIHEIDILLIDDFSLLNESRFESINNRFCQERSKHKKPFGGVRLIMAGDPYMVSPDKERRFFKSSIWGECVFVTYELRNPFRYDAKSQNWFPEINLKRFTNLHSLTLRKCSLDAILEDISETTTLVNLDLQNSRRSQGSERALFTLTTLEKLETLNVSGIDGVTDEFIVRLKRFKSLDFHRCKNITANGIVQLMKNCPDLEDLDLRWSHITFPMIVEANHATGNPINNISSERALFPLTILEKLETLNVGGIADVTDKFIVRLKRFKYLDFHSCKNITENGIVQLMKNCPDLEDLNLQSFENKDTCKLKYQYCHRLPNDILSKISIDKRKLACT
ncbi:ATP-dependent DNA helicase RRM3-like [Aphidius gifuensis]|uniref:ATP-dependent DNA helicase RRM3-like n=1 Tax=Aphidius gifuensis TaxID=684658 RepID=UPI001CDD2EBB|nr:ATP-dependent DNA helicase RRM3-like [Aphidius gifuensis]